MSDTLQVALMTPHGTVLDARVRSVRVRTAGGQVGLRPRAEPLVLVVEPGLIVLRGDDGVRFAATAGGLLESDRERCILYTPLAVVGDAEEVVAALERAFGVPDSELAARRQLAEMEQRILHELRDRPAGPRLGEHRA